MNSGVRIPVINSCHPFQMKAAARTRTKLPGAAQETTVADVEGFSEQSCQGLGVYRFLRGASREKQGVVTS